MFDGAACGADCPLKNVTICKEWRQERRSWGVNKGPALNREGEPGARTLSHNTTRSVFDAQY